MSEKTTTEMIEVMKAFAEGKEIECVNKNGIVIANFIKSENSPFWDWLHFNYRVKAEPKYRPYKDIKEMITDFCKRFRYTYPKSDSLPFIWVKQEKEEMGILINGYDTSDNTIFILLTWCDLKFVFDNYTYLDGSPCGIKEK